MGLFDKLKGAAQAVPTPSSAASVNAHGQEIRRLLAEGEPGRATIDASRDTGERMAGNAVVELELSVVLDRGEAYATTLRMPIARTDMTPYAPGTSYAVRVDRADRTRLTFSGA